LSLFIPPVKEVLFLPTKEMRTGITTGTCAAAAAKAAILALLGTPPQAVEVTTPQGKSIKVAIANCTIETGLATASVTKYAGDDPDVTDGITVTVEATLTSSTDITIKAAEGVGIVTKPGLAVPVGQPAINPGPRLMIDQAVRAVLPEGRGALLTISIPQGEQLAKKTLNSTLGIMGGLSVIGTTGIVRPMSEEAFKDSLVPQISVAKAQGYDQLVFVPGKIGQEIAVGKGLPAEAIVQTSNFVGHMLEQAVQYGIRRVLIFGHIGKIIKLAGGIFYTHNRIADARLEILAAYAASLGASREVIQNILASTATEAVLPVIEQYGLSPVYDLLAERASQRAARYIAGAMEVGTVMVTLAGDILGLDATAKEIGGRMGWNI
jgi:cobalt-precorrin-5B (C1)-methyltransferase